jgi:hypothetical protein
VKYTLRPTSRGSATPGSTKPNFLRDALKASLARQPAAFDFMVQLFVDPTKTPIEDASVPWNEHDAPFIKVATLEIPMQDFDTPERCLFAENLSFNPWRALPAHRPLGAFNRARRRIYRVLSAFRHDRNSASSAEPLATTDVEARTPT